MAEMSQGSEDLYTQANSADSSATSTVYEVGFHVVPTVGDDGVSAVVDKIRAVLEKAGSEFIKDEFPQKVTLTYTIERSSSGKREKFRDAYFGFIKFACEKSEVQALQQTLRGMPDVLRFLLIETTREDIVEPRRAVFSSDRLEGETIKKPTSAPEAAAPVSEEELDKSIDALVS